MIRVFETIFYNEDIVKLWSEAFGDARDDIMFFLKNCVNKTCLCLEYNGRVASMLFLVDCSACGKEMKYIYAACTLNEFRNKGFMSILLDYSIKSFDSVVLIPANESLVAYYNKHGLCHRYAVDDISFNENDEICEYLFEGCSLENPVALSNTELM